MKHTASVYLLPWTGESESLALDVASIGTAYLWTSEVKDEARAQELTKIYDKRLEPILDKIGERIDRIEGHLEKRKLAQKMADRTRTMLDDVEAAIFRRGSADLYVMVIILRRRLEGLGV